MTPQEWSELALALTRAALSIPEDGCTYELKNAAAQCLIHAVLAEEAKP